MSESDRKVTLDVRRFGVASICLITLGCAPLKRTTTGEWLAGVLVSTP